MPTIRYGKRRNGCRKVRSRWYDRGQFPNKSGNDVKDKNIFRWFDDSPLGRYAFEQERRFFASAARYAFGTTVQFGLSDWRLLEEYCVIRCGTDVEMQAERMAWMTDSVDLLLMPHTLECCDDYCMALAEAYRVLKPEGRLALTGLNPHSIWRLSSCFDGERLPARESCLPLPVLKKTAAGLGFSVESGKFMVYRPIVDKNSTLRVLKFMEAAGDRWWPHAAAVYGLVLVKRKAGVHPLAEAEHAGLETVEEIALTPARVKCG